MTYGGTTGQAGVAGQAGVSGSAGNSGGSGGNAGAAGAGLSAGAAGDSGGTAPTLKGPIERNGRCVLEFGDSYFETDPAVAGRIVSARAGSAEALVPSTVHPENYGSTFWTAPQSDWMWPPIAAIDSESYTPAIDVTSCTMTSTKVIGQEMMIMNDVVIVKKFSPDFDKEALVVEYTIRNEGTAAKRFAPWEITRVAPDGLTFFATDAEPTGENKPPVTTAGGAAWYKDSPEIPHDSKLFCDGKGWIAHVTPGNLLLLKTFPDIAAEQAAPNEAEIEIYTANNSVARYVEVENLGAYEEIAPGASMTWTVHWYVRALPADVAATPGSAELLAFVQQLLSP